MNQRNREKVAVTYEEAKKCFETGKLAEAKERLLSDDVVRMSKEVAYSKIYEIARNAMAESKLAIKMPETQFLNEVFYEGLIFAALQTGTTECIRSGDLSSLEQKVADSLTRELAIKVLEQMPNNFALVVKEVRMNAALDKIVEEALEELFG